MYCLIPGLVRRKTKHARVYITDREKEFTLPRGGCEIITKNGPSRERVSRTEPRQALRFRRGRTISSVVFVIKRREAAATWSRLRVDNDGAASLCVCVCACLSARRRPFRFAVRFGTCAENLTTREKQREIYTYIYGRCGRRIDVEVTVMRNFHTRFTDSSAIEIAPDKISEDNSKFFSGCLSARDAICRYKKLVVAVGILCTKSISRANHLVASGVSSIFLFSSILRYLFDS